MGLLLALHMYLDSDLLLKLSKPALPLRMVGLDPEGMLLVVVDKLLDLGLDMLQRVLELVPELLMLVQVLVDMLTLLLVLVVLDMPQAMLLPLLMDLLLLVPVVMDHDHELDLLNQHNKLLILDMLLMYQKPEHTSLG